MLYAQKNRNGSRHQSPVKTLACGAIFFFGRITSRMHYALGQLVQTCCRLSSLGSKVTPKKIAMAPHKADPYWSHFCFGGVKLLKYIRTTGTNFPPVALAPHRDKLSRVGCVPARKSRGFRQGRFQCGVFRMSVRIPIGRENVA